MLSLAIIEIETFILSLEGVKVFYIKLLIDINKQSAIIGLFVKIIVQQKGRKRL